MVTSGIQVEEDKKCVVASSWMTGVRKMRRKLDLNYEWKENIMRYFNLIKSI